MGNHRCGGLIVRTERTKKPMHPELRVHGCSGQCVMPGVLISRLLSIVYSGGPMRERGANRSPSFGTKRPLALPSLALGLYQAVLST
jgi:hypothetical protein